MIVLQKADFKTKRLSYFSYDWLTRWCTVEVTLSWPRAAWSRWSATNSSGHHRLLTCWQDLVFCGRDWLADTERRRRPWPAHKTFLYSSVILNCHYISSTIISVFYFRHNHVWNWNKIISDNRQLKKTALDRDFLQKCLTNEWIVSSMPRGDITIKLIWSFHDMSRILSDVQLPISSLLSSINWQCLYQNMTNSRRCLVVKVMIDR